MNENLELTASPVQIAPFPVEAEWIDYNGHMNVAYYVLAFDRALDQVFDALGVGEIRAKSHKCGPFTLEAHIHYLQEVGYGDMLSFTFQLLAHDQKRMHYYLEMYHAEKQYLAASMEQVSLYVDLSVRRATPYPGESLTLLKTMAAAHERLEWPARIGSAMGLRKK